MLGGSASAWGSWVYNKGQESRPLTFAYDGFINGLVAAALVICSGIVGWAVAKITVGHPVAETASATGLALAVAVGGLINGSGRLGQ